MSDSITDRIAAIIDGHRFGVRQWRDGYRHSSCMCIEEIGANEHSAHVAEVIVERLRLLPQWAAAADDPDRPGAWSEFVHTGDYRADGQEDADALDGGYVVTRYVTKWEAE